MIINLTSFLRPVVEGCLSVAQTSMLTVLPHGGQAIARRNAYKSVLHDETAAAHRRRVLDAVDRAVLSQSGNHLISVGS